MNQILNDFVSGISYFFNSVSLLWHPKLRRFVLLPLLFNIVFFISLLLLLIHYYTNINEYILAHLPTWMAVVSIIAKIIVFIIYLAITLYSFFTIATIIAAPFNGLLAEKVAHLRGQTVEEKSWMAILRDTPRLIARQLVIFFLYVPISILLTILLLVPFLHAFVLIFWVWFHARMIALIYLDYPTDNTSVSLKRLRAWIKLNKVLVFGFGGTILFFSSIPIVNFFVIPISVIAATNLWIDRGG